LSFVSDRITITEASGDFLSEPALACSELSKGLHWPVLLCRFRPALGRHRYFCNSLADHFAPFSASVFSDIILSCIYVVREVHDNE